MKEMEAARIKRREKRTINLTAMHIPLSSASSVGVMVKSKKGKRSMAGGDVDVGAAIGKELGMEKIHRRVATRGVVALFNTISMHQQERAQRAAEAGIGMASSASNTESKKTKEELQNMSKHGFLDMLKKTNASGDGGSGTNKGPFSSSSKNSADGTTKSSRIKTLKDKQRTSDGWNALKDDFMMNSKLKDWDKQMSSSDEDVDDVDDDEDDGGGGGGKKRGDIDAVMDDDDSSSGDDDDDDDDGGGGGRGKRGRGGKKRRKV